MRSTLVLLVALLLVLPAASVTGAATPTPASEAAPAAAHTATLVDATVPADAPSLVDATTSGNSISSAAPAKNDDVQFDAAGSSSDDPVIVERITVNRTPDRPGSVRVDLTYALPDNVVSFTTESTLLERDAVTLAAATGFDRQSDGSFAWDERTTAPTLSFTYDVAETYSQTALGVEGDDWAFVSLPNTYVSWRYRGTPPSFETEGRTAGPGHASGSYALDGARSTTARTIGDLNLTVVVAPTARPGATADAYVSLYRVGIRELEPGFEYDASGLFVLPTASVDDDAALGTSTRYSFWVQDEYSTLDGVENTAAHEFVHTRMGTFGGDTSRWLTEATAEYYGHVLATNTGAGSWSEFREALTVEQDAFRDATLADASTWRDELVPYEKGALVLAALDAEIAARTGGVRSLEDVLAYRFSDDDPYGDLETYENFSAAVVATTNDESMRDWLDRYVAGGETPSVPSNPDAFVLNDSMDSDDDGVPNGEEVRTNPFDADTDDGGLDDTEDPYPTDDSRPAETTTTTTTTPSITTDGSSPIGAEPTVASTTRTTTATSSGSDDAGSTTGPGSVVDSIPGFGPALAAFAVLAVALGVARRN
ncbi:hypothetical protein [Halorubellus salinus]|uniref:hypothetical protein n=1 Tax=Halorubellus salinus TaxID=755309 RepID=UPI001D085E70|nr:hypothetical protein [Halorubellus salinus]